LQINEIKAAGVIRKVSQNHHFSVADFFYFSVAMRSGMWGGKEGEAPARSPRARTNLQIALRSIRSGNFDRSLFVECNGHREFLLKSCRGPLRVIFRQLLSRAPNRVFSTHLKQAERCGKNRRVGMPREIGEISNANDSIRVQPKEKD
jgi:hypothetical protein